MVVDDWCYEVLVENIPCHLCKGLSSIVHGLYFESLDLVIPCSGRLYVVLVEMILVGFVYIGKGEGGFGEFMCLCNFYRKSMYVP